MRNIEMQAGPATSGPPTVRRLRAAWTLLAGAALCCAGAGHGVRAEETAAPAQETVDVSTQLHAEKVAVTVCGTCHGGDGNSTQPKFPRLAGQNPHYLAAQLKAFRSQSRGDPDAISYMWGMAAELDDDTIAALAAYYAKQRPDAGPRASAADLTRGREIYQQGISTEGVPACSSCHGTDAHGTQDFPRLASQHEQYILKQLGSFQSNMRKVAIMHGVAQNLRSPEMQAVAAFLQAQP